MQPHPHRTGLPLLATVDVAVCGGSVAAVATAASAARAGASVFLGCPEPYLGEDVCATGECLALDIASTSGSPLLRRLFPKKSDLPHGSAVRPAYIKRILDEELLDAGVAFRFLSYPEQLLFDAKGRAAGVVFATKSGRYAVAAKRVVDATFNGVVAHVEIGTAWPVAPRLHATAVRDGAGDSVPAPDDERDKTPAGLVDAEAAVPGESLEADLAAAEAIESEERRLRASLWTKDTNWIAERCSLSRMRRVCGEAPVGFAVVGPAAADWPDEDDGPAARIRRGEKAGAALAAAAQAEPAPNGAPRPGRGRAVSAADARLFGRACTDPRLLREAVGWTRGIPAPPVLGCLVENGDEDAVKEVDVLVVGGGTAGAPAAIAAARAGAKVLCVEPLGMLGGTATAGTIANYYYGYREGFTSECTEAMAALHGGWNFNTAYSNPMWKSEWLRAELEKAGAEVWFGATATGALVSPRANHVCGAIVHTRWGCRLVSAALVIDATGNADIAALAGAPTREAWQEDFVFQGSGTHSRPFRPAYRNTDWTFVLDSDIADQTRAFVAARRKFADAFDMNPIVGSRERRQIVGDVTLTPVDIYLETPWPDTVARCHSNFDTHGMTVFPLFHVLPPDRLALDAWLPMGALVPKGWTGLAATGLAVSAQRDTMPVLRMEPECQNQAYAVGLAAAWLAASGETDFRRADFERLHRVLVDYRRCLPERILLDPAGGAAGFADALGPVLDGPLSTHGEIALAYAHRTETVRALTSSVHDANEEGAVRLRRALLLAVLGNAAGEPELLSALRSAKGWDEGWNYRGMGQYCRSMSPLDDVVACLGRIRSTQAATAVLRLAAAIGPDTELSHVRAFALYAEGLAKDASLRPKLARALSKALAAVGPLHAWSTLADEVAATDGNWCNTETRNASLKELFLARALVRCGDDARQSGAATLRAYAGDVRGQFAASAYRAAL